MFDGGACVLEIKSPDLLERNEALREQGIHSKFPDYRAHITITYKKPKGLKVEGIEPYRGPIILGPEIFEEASSGWKADYEETPLADLVESTELVEKQLTDFSNADRVYDIFKASYDDATGQSWSKDQFLYKARLWTFYGDDTGFVAFRQQASGLRKLVGVAGDTSGIVRGLKQLQQENKPTWGAVSGKIAAASKRYGFIAPHTYIGGALVIKLVMKSIPSSVFGGNTPTVNSDGSIEIEVAEIGNQKKYFIANREYFVEMLRNNDFRKHVENTLALKFINKILGKSDESE